MWSEDVLEVHAPSDDEELSPEEPMAGCMAAIRSFLMMEEKAPLEQQQVWATV